MRILIYLTIFAGGLLGIKYIVKMAISNELIIIKEMVKDMLKSNKKVKQKIKEGRDNINAKNKMQRKKIVTEISRRYKWAEKDMKKIYGNLLNYVEDIRENEKMLGSLYDSYGELISSWAIKQTVADTEKRLCEYLLEHNLKAKDIMEMKDKKVKSEKIYWVDENEKKMTIRQDDSYSGTKYPENIKEIEIKNITEVLNTRTDEEEYPIVKIGHSKYKKYLFATKNRAEEFVKVYKLHILAVTQKEIYNKMLGIGRGKNE